MEGEGGGRTYAVERGDAVGEEQEVVLRAWWLVHEAALCRPPAVAGDVRSGRRLQVPEIQVSARVKNGRELVAVVRTEACVVKFVSGIWKMPSQYEPNVRCRPFALMRFGSTASASSA